MTLVRRPRAGALGGSVPVLYGHPVPPLAAILSRPHASGSHSNMSDDPAQDLPDPGPVTIYTLGHSTRSLEELVAMLRAHRVELLVDVRRFPGSRRHPHFARESLERALPDAGIEYLWLEGLGGRRSRRQDSPHTAWRVAGFASYADHMDTGGFEEAAQRLLERARQATVAVMCAEALPERCHRRLLSDWLTVRGVEVVHVLDATRTRPHQLPDFVRVEGGRLVYDGGQLGLLR